MDHFTVALVHLVCLLVFFGFDKSDFKVAQFYRDDLRYLALEIRDFWGLCFAVIVALLEAAINITSINIVYITTHDCKRLSTRSLRVNRKAT